MSAGTVLLCTCPRLLHGAAPHVIGRLWSHEKSPSTRIKLGSGASWAMQIGELGSRRHPIRPEQQKGNLPALGHDLWTCRFSWTPQSPSAAVRRNGHRLPLPSGSLADEHRPLSPKQPHPYLQDRASCFAPERCAGRSRGFVDASRGAHVTSRNHSACCFERCIAGARDAPLGTHLNALKRSPTVAFQP